MPENIRKPVMPPPYPLCERGGCDKGAMWHVKGYQGDVVNTCSDHLGVMMPPGGGVVTENPIK